MTDRGEAPEKSIKEHLEEILQGALDVLESLVQPEPELIPVPVRGGRRPIRR